VPGAGRELEREPLGWERDERRGAGEGGGVDATSKGGAEHGDAVGAFLGFRRGVGIVGSSQPHSA
jgi:hypothetical protein